MRLIFKIIGKLILPLILISLTVLGVMYGPKYLAQNPENVELGDADLSAEETGLITKVLDSAQRFLSGSATRDELASELSEELYSNRPDAETMSALGIEMVHSNTGEPVKESTSEPTEKPSLAKKPLTMDDLTADANETQLQSKPSEPSTAETVEVRSELLVQIWEKIKIYKIELGVVAALSIGLFWYMRRRKRSRMDTLLPAAVTTMPSDSEPFDPTYDVQSLSSEEFELLVALIYQRQGYRVTMPAALSGYFMLAHKAEKVLVQCKRLAPDNEIPVERVSDLHDAMSEAGANSAKFVASCKFSWDARNYGKSRGITLINARILDELIADAQQSPEEDLLAVAEWAPEFIKKVKMSHPQCPSCYATMEQIQTSHGFSWVCSERPSCRGRRNARVYQRQINTPLEIQSF